jgi:hypothetical protein
VAKPTKLLKSLETLREKRYFTLSVPQADGEEKLVRFDIVSELRISDAGLHRQMSDQPQQIFFWLNVKASLQRKVRKAEQDYHETYSKHYLAYRVHLATKGPTVTEPWLKAETDSYPDVHDAKTAWNDALDQLGLVTAITEALDHRRSMLVQRASRSRVN